MSKIADLLINTATKMQPDYGGKLLPGMKSIVVIKLHCDKLSQQAVSIEESKVDHIKQEKIKIKKSKNQRKRRRRGL